jgi:hypothetical protein
MVNILKNTIINDTDSRVGKFGKYYYTHEAVKSAYDNFKPTKLKFTHRNDPLLDKAGLGDVGIINSVKLVDNKIVIDDYTITNTMVNEMLINKEIPSVSIEGEISKYHTDNDIIAVDDFSITAVALVDKPACKSCTINYSNDAQVAAVVEEKEVINSTINTINNIIYMEDKIMVKETKDVKTEDVKEVSESDESVISKIKSLLNIKEEKESVISITEEDFKARIADEILPIKEEMVKIQEELVKTTEALKLSVSEQERLEKKNGELTVVIDAIKSGKVDISEERVSEATIDVAAKEAEIVGGFTSEYVKGV